MTIVRVFFIPQDRTR